MIGKVVMDKATRKLVKTKMEELRELRQEVETSKKTVDTLQAEIVGLLEASNETEFYWKDSDGFEQTTSLRQSSRGKILGYKLKRLVPDDVWERITYEEIDKDALRLEQEAGNIDNSIIEQAKAICAECPVKLKCRTYILEIESKPNVAGRYGIWGGTTPEERKAIVARQKLASTV
jgi:hypothetical protein